jgi:hypothetical protein
MLDIKKLRNEFRFSSFFRFRPKAQGINCEGRGPKSKTKCRKQEGARVKKGGARYRACF